MVKVPADKVLRLIAANEKILDIQKNDTATRISSISSKVPPNCVGVILNVVRQSGTGSLDVYPNEGSAGIRLTDVSTTAVLYIVNQRIKYVQTVANDDFDLYMLGYFIEGTIES